jgi:hypothetical protein
MNGLTAQHLFETPLIRAELAGADAIGRDLLQRIAERDFNPGVASTSDSRMLRWGGEAAVAILEQCIAIADRHTVDVEAEQGQTRYGWWADLRAQWGGERGIIEQSFYPGAYFSAVTVIGPAGTEVGELTLEDPRMPMLHMEDAGLRVRTAPGAEPLAGSERIPLHPGQLLMFPAWLRRRLVFAEPYRQSIALTLNLTAFLATAPVGSEPERGPEQG